MEAKKQYNPVRITISGEAGSGKSTVAAVIAKKLKIKHYSTGDYMRKMAVDRKVTIIELNKIGETDPSIDKELDEWQMQLEKNKKKEFVIDSRLGFHFIPTSTKIFLHGDLLTRAERIFTTKRTVEKNTTLKKTIENIKKRQALERKRYKHKYGVDYLDFSNYDIIFDTTIMKPKDIAEKIVMFVKKK